MTHYDHDSIKRYYSSYKSISATSWPCNSKLHSCFACFELKCIINTIEIFFDLNECVDYLTDVQTEKVFIIISGTVNQQTLSIIRGICQVEKVFSLSNYKMYDDPGQAIHHLCNSLKQAIRRCDENCIDISLMPCIGILRSN